VAVSGSARVTSDGTSIAEPLFVIFVPVSAVGGFMDERLSPIHCVTNSASMQRALDALLLAAQSEAPIMLRAEIGSEVAALARLAHDNSRHRNRPFLTLACPSITELPSESLVTASGGTLFLDEVGDLADTLQLKLLNLLDELSTRGEMTRVISATKRDLTQDAGGGHFRKDLFFRLNVLEIRVPPLRERPEDILPLVRDLIGSLSTDLGRSAPALSKEAASMLIEHPWPGNLREVMNVIERALLIWPADTIQPEVIAEILRADTHRRPRVGDDVALRDLERAHISRIISRLGNLTAAARVLGIDKTTLWRRLKRDERDREAETQRRTNG
jgi:NtrC-family two-component system response regulator AlgB